MNKAKTFAICFALLAGIIVLLTAITNKPVTRSIAIDLPEEIQAADSTDTMDAVVVHDTLFVRFRTHAKP